MITIIIQLLKIYGSAKDLHYSASGPEFYGQHLLYDEIAGGCQKQIDRIKENFYLARGLAVPTAKETYSAAAHELPDRATPENLRDTISSTISLIDEVATGSDFRLTEGEKTLIGDISDALAQKLGFLNRLLAQGN